MDELNKDEKIVEEIKVDDVVIENEKVDDVPPVEPEGDKVDEEPTVEDADKVEEEVKEDTAEIVEEKKEEVVDEDPKTDDVIVEETPEVVEEEKKDVVEDIEAIRKERDELLAEREEAKEEADFRANIENNERIFNDYIDRLSKATADALESYGIDTTKTLEEIRKDDPTKAKIAEGIIEQAQTMRMQEEAKYAEANATKVREIVFSKASRLLEKYELSAEQADVVADTFLNIMNEVGIKDLGEDLKAKVELAVARGRMLKPRLEKVANDVADIMQTVKEDIEDIKNEKAMKAPEVEKVVEAPAPVVDDTDFKESAAPVSNNTVQEVITVDNVMDKMAALPFRERTAFYKEHFAMIEEAAKKHNREDK